MSSSNSPKELITFKLTISDFTADLCKGAVSFPSNKQIKFVVCCCPDHDIWDGKYMTMYLYLHKSNKDQLNVRYRVSILNANGDKCETQERVANFSKKSKRFYDGAFLWKRDYLLDASNGFLVNGKLTTYWEIEEIDTATGSSAQLDFNRLSQDYESLLESGKMSDAVLVVGNNELPVHKLILSTRSPVFAAMFAHSTTKEAQENRVKIKDVDVEVLEQLLKYMYTGTVESLDQFAAELLVAADKYQLDSLKTICEQFLCSVITTESVSDYFLLADMYQATELNTKCCDFIADNGIEVMVTEGWKRIFAKPNLTAKVLERMSHKISDSKSNKNN